MFSQLAKKILIFTLIFSWVFSGWPPIDFELDLPPKLEYARAEVAPLQIDDKTIDFTFTDDNETYIGLARGEVYFSVTNIGDKTESVNVQAYFPDDNGGAKQLQKWTENIAYEINVPEYGEMIYFCEEGWQRETEMLEESFICQSINLIKYFDSLNE